ncbi:membrane-bound lytic murein transglycosylase B precursor [Variibacter gotjawalensis]|uniref:Membrane-bound lytic murein transglycosylase B n=1 Tax=Variibacter gotjawalensis TaxID=1333996 RepID=A0A0S3PZ78_9BRAD|nr:lytic murein transglycosylase [Variibacter gotjawalensis]NIK47078.1 lytic murein transglycosylase [Variibacter gotjawalensis]RZS48980.1 lytic murein transglycosylase [Variibacter gotjawalensis]BAT61240.1 membrane-bound lytic murein transglycosylase B precursor [Variibacter gotjawalensis]
MRGLTRIVGALLIASCAATPALAAQCGGDFESWLPNFKRDASGQGVSARGLAALDGVTQDPTVLRLDRNQGHFRVPFEEFIAKRVTSGRLAKGRQMLQQHAGTLARVEAQYGVAPEIIVAIWGMETDYGAVQGKQSVVRSLATLAHDCRRTEMFQRELIAALKIIDRGDFSSADLRGAWAGEIGQTQFLASNFVKYAVDFDGNGRRDLIRSVPDVLASTANLLRSHGWRKGPYGEGTANFQVLNEWNKSNNYQRAIALFAQRLVSGQ